jgi:lipopolysaccharide transport system ATP-binding protein
MFSSRGRSPRPSQPIAAERPCETASKPVVEFRGVSKSYVLHGPPLGIKHTLLHLPSLLREARSRPAFLALEGISFTVARGESFGIIGPNGSGKSTLLALAAGALSPTRGQVVVRGRVCPLLAVGAGFHGDLTGRENALLNGMILGLSRRQARDRLPAIRAFADIGSFFDEPIRTYSAGMVARLGFGVAVHTDPDLLLVDEVLAVGDEAFQARCMERIEALRRRGTTLLIVSHQREHVARFCDRVLQLRGGRIESIGRADALAPEPLRGGGPA